MPDHQREDRAVEAFCRILSLVNAGTITVLTRPDRDSPEQGGCEAIVQRDGVRQALEHTTFDILLNQRLDDARLRSVLDPAADAIAKLFPDCHITIAVPLGAVTSGQDWSIIRQTFQDAVVNELGRLPPERQHVNLTIPGLFSATVFRRASAFSPGCHVARMVSEEDMKNCAVNLAKALAAKEEQLRPYALSGLRTVLLLDNDDLGLMDAGTAASQFREAYQRSPVEIDEVYLVDGTEQPPWIYPIKLGAAIHPLPEWRRFFERQYRVYYPH